MRGAPRGLAQRQHPGQLPLDMTCRLLATLLAGALLPCPLAAQFVPLTLPKGQVGMELRTGFTSWDQRFRDGMAEPAGADFSRSAIDAGWLPSLAAADLRLARLTGVTGAMLNAGGYGVTQLTTLGDLGLGLQLGVTNRLTISGMVPFRQVRVQTIASYDSTNANSGLNPADPALGSAAGLGATLAFFLEFDAAIAEIQTRLASGSWSGSPSTEALAMTTLTQARAMREDLYALLVASETRSPFVPLTGSSLGTALVSSITALQGRIGTDLGIAGFSRLPALPTAAPTTDDWNRYLADPAGPVAGSLQAPTYMALGDIELGAAYLIVDRFSPLPGATQVRAAIQGTVRLRTSQLENPNRFFDLGTGDRQPDAEVALVTDLARGRTALRVGGWYTRQFAGNQQRRIGPPDQPIQEVRTLAALRKDPGDIVGVGVFPAYRFTSSLAFLAGAEWWSKGRDSYAYVADQPPLEGLDPQMLAIDSEATALTFRAGLTFSHRGARQPGGAGTPLDASVTWERVVSATGGRVPKAESVRAMLRVYTRFW